MVCVSPSGGFEAPELQGNPPGNTPSPQAAREPSGHNAVAFVCFLRLLLNLFCLFSRLTMERHPVDRCELSYGELCIHFTRSQQLWALGEGGKGERSVR